MRWLPLLLLAACATPQEQAAQREAERQAYVASLTRQCNGFGFQQGTDAHRNCMLQLHQTEQQRRAAIGAAIIGSGALNPKPYQPVPLYQMPTNPSTQTTCQRIGDFLNCTTR